MSDNISHKGKIVEITPVTTTVEIVSESACSACHAKGLCGVSESKVKLIQLPTRGWDSWQVDDEVDVVLKSTMGHLAVWLAFVIPLCVLVLTLLLLSLAGKSELCSGIGALCSAALYYLVLWCCRKKLNREFVFELKQYNNIQS